MNKSDFDTIFSKCLDINEIKKLFRGLAMQNHPDRGGNTRTMQDLNNAYFEALQGFENRKQGTNETTGEDFYYHYNETVEKEILAQFMKFAGFDDLIVEIIGTWLWVSGNTRDHKTELKRAGFKFSATKEAWYYHNGKYYKSTSEATSLDSIRDNYGITKDNRSPKQHYPVFSN